MFVKFRPDELRFRVMGDSFYEDTPSRLYFHPQCIAWKFEYLKKVGREPNYVEFLPEHLLAEFHALSGGGGCSAPSSL